MSNRDLEKVAYRVAELTRGVEGLTRARQVARSIVSGKELDNLVKDAESAQDRLDTQDELINEIGDAADWWVPSAELTADAADEAHEAKMQALESLSDAIAALDGIENLEEELTTEIASAQAAADAAATEANLAKLQALQNVQDILTLSSEQAVIADEARDAWNAAVQAGQDAATAAGIAAGKGKTIIQSAAPAVADRLAQNLWIDTTGGANTPKRWSGSAWVAVSDKVAVDAAAAAVAAQSAADAAATAAASAGQAATVAQTTANGKTKLFRSTAAASGQGSTVGDVWWRFGNSQFTGPVIGQWTWSGSTWVPNTIGSEVIEALTVDKLTVTGGAKIPTAVIDTLVSDQAFFNAVHSNRIVVGGQNIHGDPLFRAPSAWTQPSYVQSTGGEHGGGSFLIPATNTQAGGYPGYAPSTVGFATPVRPGTRYRVSVRFKSDLPITGTYLVSIYANWRNEDGTAHSTGSRFDAPVTPGGTWATIEGITPEAPAGASRLSVGLFTQAAHNSAVRFSDPSIEAMVGAVLIEDGAVTAPKITASQELSAKVAEFIEVKASQLVADNAAMDAAFIGQLVGDQAFLASMYTNRVIVDSVDFAPGPGGAESAWQRGSATAILNSSLDPTGKFIRTDPANSNTEARRAYGPVLPLKEGTKVRCAFTVTFSVRVPDADWTASMQWLDAAGAQISATVIKRGSATGRVDEVLTAPAGTVQARIFFSCYALAGETGFWGFRNFDVRPQVGAILLEDGAVTSDALRADAIDGKTITGATIRTAASGQRMQLDVNGLRAFNSSGASTASITAATGGLELTGILYSENVSSGITYRSSIGHGELLLSHQAGGSSGSMSIFPGDITFDGNMNKPLQITSMSSSTGSGISIAAAMGDITLNPIKGKVKIGGDTNWANFTRASGMSGTAQWRRYLGVIYVRMNITTSVASGAHVQLGTLPAAARPSEPTALNASGTAGPICTAYVDTGGVIRFRNANNHTATAPYVDGCFLAKDI